jgi:tetratricopeptide (TPR) repeat protein
MDIAALASSLTNALLPLLPYLLKAGEGAAEETGKTVVDKSLKGVRSLWTKLKPKVKANPAALEAMRDAAQLPEDEVNLASLREQLVKLLTEDRALADEVSGWLNRNQGSVVNVSAGGERSAAIGGNAGPVITGDRNRDVYAVTGHTVIINPGHGSPDSPVIRPLHQAPRPPADFTGRDAELQELLSAIAVGGVTISGLQGMGGIGKTSVALKLVELLKPRYPDAQFFLDLKGASNQPLATGDALAHVVRSYHPTAKLPESETELRGLYLSVLEGQRALLLMDNAADAQQVEPLIPPAGCLLLVTSRQHFRLPGLAAKNLDTMTPEDARALLLEIEPRIGSEADEFATLCGHLPLALRLAGSAMAKYRNLSPAEYLQRLHDRQRRLQLIEASLSLSYELLREEWRQRWRWLAVFPDTFATDAAAAVWEVEASEALDTLGELMAASLVEWNESTGRYRLHDLARLFADAKFDGAERDVAVKRFAIHYRNVLATADKLYLQGSGSVLRGLSLFDLEWNNIQAGHASVAAQRETAAPDVMSLGMTYPAAGAYVLHLRQHSHERIRWQEIALAAARKLQNRKYEGYALGNLGLAYAALGEPRRAIQFHEQALLIDREIGYRRGEGQDLGNLGVAYAALGDTRKAVQFSEQCLSIAREIGDREGEGNAVGNLGLAYRNLGETRQAIQFHEQYLAIAREIGDRRGEGNALGNLGVAYADLGETRQAIQFYEQALLIDREIGDRRGEGTDLWNISLALNQLGERAQAIQHAAQALSIREQIEDPNAAKVREQLAAWREQSIT